MKKLASLVNVYSKRFRSANVGKEDDPALLAAGDKEVRQAGTDEEAPMRRFRHTVEKAPSQSRRGVLAKSGQRVQTQPEQRAPAQSGQRAPAQYGQRAPSQSGRVKAQSGQSFSTQYQSRQDKLPIRVPSQSGIHSSPTQARQRASQSGQSTPNESLQISAQSHQRTPEPQSRQRTSGAQSEPIEYTPTPSHPSTLNVSSTAANDNVVWNIGSTQRD
ncbi:hypothetical protein AG4045_023901 [Apium graveolens]|uniref:Uncharacterized protein n=1 Tax=Apium graveolens TaxID=4045 RepID=A0A6L5B8Q5_APIGR|nr:hypothetical protein AG4045_023901 [Apium graveolens]